MTKVNQSLLYPIVSDNVKFYSVQFYEQAGMFGKEYTYKSEHTREVGDIVIVEARDWYQVAKVSKAVNMPSVDDLTKSYRWIIGKVQLIEHTELVKYEQEIIDRVNEELAEALRMSIRKHLGIDDDMRKKLLKD